MIIIKAIILNAGEDKQLEKLVKDKPKCLVEIEGTSLLEIQINILHKCGIDDVTVVTGYGAEYINIPGLKYYYNKEYENTNVLHSLFCARDEMNDEVLIIYGDILFEEQIIKRTLESKSDLSIGVMVNWEACLKDRKDAKFKDLEMLSFNSENKVEKIGKNLEVDSENIGLFTGIIKCSKYGVNVLKSNYDRICSIKTSDAFLNSQNLKEAWMTDLLNEMCQLGIPLHCVIIEKGWIEINTEEDYSRALTNIKFISKLVNVKTDWTERSKTYNKIDWVNRDETLEAMVKFAGDLNDKNVLDLGTGTGKVLKTLKSNYPYGHYYGVDISEGMMNEIEKSYGFNLSISKIENLECFEDNFFDVVTARMVFHHSENLSKAMNEVNRVLKPGGSFIICEGNPPDLNSVRFYEEMFKFKENRHTFLLDDIVNLFVNHNFYDVTSKTIVLNNMSLNNWLSNAGVPFRNVDIIRNMHYEADLLVKKAYNMNIIDNDILMDWKFSVTTGIKKKN